MQGQALQTGLDDEDICDNEHRDRIGYNEKHQSIFKNKVILSILVTETAERVAYFGFRAVLVLYFTDGLKYSEATSVSLFASVSGLAYLSPLVGAVLADNRWGRYNTILRFGVVYSIGLFLITFGAYQLDPNSCSLSSDGNVTACDDSEAKNLEDTPDGNILVARSFSFVGLILVCLGTGGIKPCVSAFGADQVVLSDDDNHLQNHESDRMQLTPGPAATKAYSDVDNEDVSEVPENADKTTEGATNATHKPVKEDDVREFFNSFYFCINVGALLSFAIIPIIRADYGFGAAFFIPTIFMTGALGIFLSQRKAYKHRRRDPSQPSLFTTLYMCSTIFLSKVRQKLYISGGHMPVSTTSNTPSCVEEDHPEATEQSTGNEVIDRHDECNQVRRDAEQVMHLMPLMLFFPVFWMLYDQQGSVWTLQATHLNRHGLEPEQALFLNPLEIMLFIPLFDKIIYPRLEAKGFNIQPLRRMEYGMFLTAVAFFASTLLEYSIQNSPPETISLAWQIPQITILTVAEILLNVTGLEFAYSQAPDSMQALILAVFLFMTAIGDGLGSLLFATFFRKLNLTVTMIICAVSMLVNLAFFSIVARRWKPYRATHHDRQSSEGEDEGFELVPSGHGMMS